MINPKHTALNDKEKGIELWEHMATGLRFACEGAYLNDYLEGIQRIPDDQSVSALSAVEIVTGASYRCFSIRAECPGQMNRLLDILKDCAKLDPPDIRVTREFFNSAYGIGVERRHNPQMENLQRNAGRFLAKLMPLPGDRVAGAWQMCGEVPSAEALSSVSSRYNNDVYIAKDTQHWHFWHEASNRWVDIGKVELGKTTLGGLPRG